MSLHVDVIDKGYFPVEIPPAFSTSSFAGATGYLPTDLNKFAQKSSRRAFHSIPRCNGSHCFPPKLSDHFPVAFSDSFPAWSADGGDRARDSGIGYSPV